MTSPRNSEQTVHANFPGIAGVGIYGPGAGEFEAALPEILGRAPRSLLEPALPYSVIVENLSSRALVLLGVRFDMIGPQAKQVSVVHYADTLRNPEKSDLLPGVKRFICAEPSYTSLVVRGEASTSTRSRMNLDNLRRMLQVRPSLDCVAFDDGLLFGPDSQGCLQRFAAESESESSLVARVLVMEKSPIAEIEELLFEAMQDANDRGRRTAGRKLLEGLESGGRDELLRRAGTWRCRIPLTRDDAA